MMRLTSFSFTMVIHSQAVRPGACAHPSLSFAPRQHPVLSPGEIPRMRASPHVVAGFHFCGLSGLIEGL